MPTAPESWTRHLLQEFERYFVTFVVGDGTRYRCTTTGRSISTSQFAQIRAEVIATATTDTASLAYQMLRQSRPNAHASEPCPTCDAAIRLAWGVSKTRRMLGLPASGDIARAAITETEHAAR